MNFVPQSFMFNIFISDLRTDSGFRLFVSELKGNQEELVEIQEGEAWTAGPDTPYVP